MNCSDNIYKKNTLFEHKLFTLIDTYIISKWTIFTSWMLYNFCVDLKRTIQRCTSMIHLIEH
jgi:hypothetical protein